MASDMMIPNLCGLAVNNHEIREAAPDMPDAHDLAPALLGDVARAADQTAGQEDAGQGRGNGAHGGWFGA